MTLNADELRALHKGDTLTPEGMNEADWEWLLMQLARWPTRVDESCTTNVRFLMGSAVVCLSSLLAERDALKARVERLEGALVTLRDLPIVENNEPDTLHLNGEACRGPVVDWTFSIVRKVKEIARVALKGDER